MKGKVSEKKEKIVNQNEHRIWFNSLLKTSKNCKCKMDLNWDTKSYI